MVVPDTTVYLINSALLGLGWLVIVGLAARESGYARRLGFVASIPALSMACAYLFMSIEFWTYETAGREQSITRFFGYTFALLAVTYLMHETIDLSGRQSAKLAIVFLLAPWLNFVSWFLTGTPESIVTAASVGFYVYAAYLMYVPLNEFAVEAGGKRRLFFAKLRNLFVLCYGTLIITSAASQQVLGFLTEFISSTTAGYIDLVLMLGVGFLTLSSMGMYRAATGDEIHDSAEDRPTPGNAD